MVSYSSVLTAISKVSGFICFCFILNKVLLGWNEITTLFLFVHLQFDDFSRELCIKSLLEIMDMFSNRLRCSSVNQSHPSILESVRCSFSRMQLTCFLSCVSLLQLPWKGRGVYWAVPCHAVYCGLAPAGLCVVLWETAGVRRSACVRKQSESLSGAHDQSVTQYQEQSPGAHRTPGGTRCVYLLRIFKNIYLWRIYKVSVGFIKWINIVNSVNSPCLVLVHL